MNTQKTIAGTRSLEELQKQYSGAGKPGAPGGRGPMGGPGPRRGGGPGVRAKGKPKNMRATVIRLLSYVAKYRFQLVLVFLFMITNTLTSLYAGYQLKPIFNMLIDTTVTASDRIASLLHTLLILACVYAVGIVTNYVQARLMLKISQNTTEALRRDLFNSVQELPVRFFDGTPTGETMSRFTNDIDAIDMMINHSLTGMVSGVINLIGTFAMMLYTNVWLTIITIVFIPIFAKGGGAIAKLSTKYYSGQQAALGAVNGYIEESVSGQKVVKVFNHEDICVEEFTALNNDMRDKQFRAQFWGGVMGPIMGNTSQISYALTAGIGGLLCLAGRFDVGGLVVFVNYSRQFSMPINMISGQMATIFSALACAERVFTVMDQPQEEADREGAQIMPADTPGRVELEHVTFGYNPDKVVLRDITLTAEPGQKIAFVGSTGAGKTTITNLLNRFYDIQEGEIRIDGISIRDYTRDSLRGGIAMVLQDTHLFTGTVMENIRYGRPDATDDEVVAAAKTASAHSFIMRLSDGYQTMLEGDGANLSQGQRQLLNIARAAISKAPILVLDEATSSVDTRTERHIEHGLARLMKNRTTFVIAHRLSTVRNSDAIMVLERGEIIERGSHDELLALGGRYYELYTGVKELD
ncbi:MAG: ABC transporter ATP-binding protein [Ruminococcaceae bacterium]|nr:ABC transporter ATP-binding protein [Oscillospiraceae bacterium]